MRTINFFLIFLTSWFVLSCEKAVEDSTPPILTNNPLRTALDSAIHRRAQFILKDRPQMSFVVGVIQQGQRKLYSYGSVIKGKQQLPTENTLYEIGEVTSLLTAIAVLQKLNERGDSLNKYIEELIPFSMPLALQNTITMRQVLTHFSTFPAFPEGVSSTNDLAFKNYPKDKFLNFIVNYQGPPRPGGYSFVNFALMGVYLEHVYDKSYELLYYDHIRPGLGLINSKVLTSGFDEANYPPGYNELNQAVPHWDDLGVFKCVHSVKATPKDMLHFLDLQINPAQGLWGKAIQEIQQNPLFYLSFEFNPSQPDFFYSEGDTPGFSTTLCFNPKQQKGVVVLSNHTYSLKSGMNAKDFYEAF